MEIIRGKIPHAKKFTIYGSEGIGKSTFASKFPVPIFIDTEGSTKEIDVARFEKPTSWTMLLEQIQYVKNHPDICKTLVIDTIDWAEQMCIESVCNKYQKNGLESFSYGSGYIYVREEFGRFLNKLEDVVECGVNVVLIAHAQLRKFEQPDEMGAYDRYELKLGKKTQSQTSPLVKEWSDVLLFANYKTISIAVDDKGKKHKAQGGTRVMYTTHHPCWDAKNRYSLPAEMPFDFAGIAHLFGEMSSVAPKADSIPKAEPIQEQIPDEMPDKVPDKMPTEVPKGEKIIEVDQKPDFSELDNRIPKALRDLMNQNMIFESEIQAAVAQRGYYPADTPIANYEADFISGVLVGAWEQVMGMIQKIRDTQVTPFD